MASKYEAEINRAVKRWSAVMRETLMANRHKGGWTNMTVPELLRMIHEEMGELVEAIMDDDGAIVVRAEAVDVANMAMMLCDVVAIEVSAGLDVYDSHGNSKLDQRGEV